MDEQYKQPKKPKILILTNPENSIDSLLVILTLSQIYGDTHELEVLVTNSMPPKFTQNMSLKHVKFVENLPEQKFLLQFKKQPNKVQSIQWNQTEDNVNLYVTMTDGLFNEKDFDFQYQGGTYEKIFLLNIESLSDLVGFNSQIYKYLFENTDVIALGREFKDPLAKLGVIYNPVNSGISEDMYDFTEKEGVKLTPQAANSILAGIYFATDNFKEQIKNPKTFQVAAKLMESGAKPTEAIAVLANFK
ncbi:hypothetical protein JW978_02920 [Candidatus Dojkabacteria bacterium]|nr:hypothetical protein [Candidatus Dojkabacteria bacterium]